MSRRRRVVRYHDTSIVMSDSRSLILIDAEPIKRAEQDKCKKVIHQMDLARERLRRFNEESQPAFEQWFNSTFGREITEIRELAQKLEDLQRLVLEVEDYKFFAQCSYREAYHVVMERRSHPELFAEESEKSEGYFENPFDEDDRCDADDEANIRAGFESYFGPRHKWRGSKAEYDAMYEEFKESYTSPFEDDIFMDSEEINFAHADSTERESANQESRLKTLYRTLARKLHPDVNLELDQKRKDLWQKVQDAYVAKDVERLETLSAMNEIFDDNVKSVESVWSLKSLYEELRSGLRHLKRQINRCSKEIAWGFEKAMKKPEKMMRFRNEIAAQLMNHKADLLDRIEYGEKHIERWKNPTPSKKSRSRFKSQGTYKRSRASKAF